MDSENPFRAQAGRGAFDSRRWLLEVAEQKRKKKKRERERKRKKKKERVPPIKGVYVCASRI